jgi:anti-sigma28 factor (negative regulator of flagellin synthesis)
MEIRNLSNAFHRIENSPTEVSTVAPRMRSYSSSPGVDAPATSASDHADLRVAKAFSSAEGVRGDKIKVTQAAIQAGTYHVSGADVADRLIDELKSY